MQIGSFDIATETLPGAAKAERCVVDFLGWLELAQAVAAADGHLVAIWGVDDRDRGRGFGVRVAYGLPEALLIAELPLASEPPVYPDLAATFPAADRMQRAMFDLLGLQPLGAEDDRAWLRHGAWPRDVYPLRRTTPVDTDHVMVPEVYPFVSVTGEGVHEIPVGPVHAGTIEPGHFRFSIIGERVLRLEEHLGYKHKGIEKRFEGLAIPDAARLAARVSGDSTVAYGWAFAMAVEAALDHRVRERAAWLRALALERERVANHLGDLGFIGNDAGLGFALAQFSRLRENWLRSNAALFGHRLAMDFVVPGGVAGDMEDQVERDMRLQARDVEVEVLHLRSLLDDHAGLQDRLRRCGVVTPELARRLGLTGLAGRASGVARDLRVQSPTAPYDRIGPRLCGATDGDVAARAAVRFDEIVESLHLIQRLLDTLPPREESTPLPDAKGHRFGVGRVEGWRGEVLVALELDEGAVRRVRPHDPSWQNWPVLEHAILGNIVPDFPLINKSFNLSYAGVDL